MSCGCSSKSQMSSWNDLLCQPPVDPRDVIAFCRLGGVEGVWALSSDYNQPAGASVWVPSPVAIQTESLVTTNGADRLQNVFDAQSWNQMHRTVNVAATVAPSLVIYGALDTDGPAFRVRCTKSTEFSRFVLSPVRLYQNARSTFNALLLVDGATHFRWIQAHDDVGKVSNFERERERNLILDEQDDMGTVGRVFYNHDLILRSYATYIYRMLPLNQTDRTGDVRPSRRLRNMVVTRNVDEMSC